MCLLRDHSAAQQQSSKEGGVAGNTSTSRMRATLCWSDLRTHTPGWPTYRVTENRMCLVMHAAHCL